MLRQRSLGKLHFDSPSQLRRFPIATKKVLTRSYSYSLQLLYTVGGNQARLDACSEFKILERSLYTVICTTSFHPPSRKKIISLRYAGSLAIVANAYA